MERLRILLVDDHPMTRKGMHLTLSSLPDATVIGEAATEEEAVEQASSLQPDLVMMDLTLRDESSGIEATRRIVQQSPHIAVLVVSMWEDDSLVFRAMRAGARGYVLKHADDEELVRAVQAVASGEAIFSPAIATKVLRYLSRDSEIQLIPDFPTLTPREREILDLIAQAQSNREIARHFGVTPKTVSNHISNIFHKLQVADRAHAIVRAKEAGLGRPLGVSVRPAAAGRPQSEVALGEVPGSI
jgi:DNA-binding NarL/FixJ family response regulator